MELEDLFVIKYELGSFAAAVFCGANMEPSIDASKLKKRRGVFRAE